MSKGNIGVTSDNIFPVIKKFLYSDHEIFLRELISNAVDATQKLKTLSSVGEAKGDLGDLRVRVTIDKEKKTLTVSDHGIGMTAEEVDKYINQIAFSGAEEFLNQYKDKAEAIIGHFGLGFYSAFMVSKKVEIFSQSYKEDAKAVRWSCEGNPEFTMEDTIKAERGTDIVLHIDDEFSQYLEDASTLRTPPLKVCCASTASSCPLRLPSVRRKNGKMAKKLSSTKRTSSTILRLLGPVNRRTSRTRITISSITNCTRPKWVNLSSIFT